MIYERDNWARNWLEEVDEARRALKRAEAILETRREAARCVGGGAYDGGGRGASGTNTTEARVMGYVEADQDRDDVYRWAAASLRQFDKAAASLRTGLRGTLLEGLDVVEMRYRHGASVKQIMAAFALSRSTVYERIYAFVDYLDFIGREETLGPGCVAS